MRRSPDTERWIQRKDSVCCTANDSRPRCSPHACSPAAWPARPMLKRWAVASASVIAKVTTRRAAAAARATSGRAALAAVMDTATRVARTTSREEATVTSSGAAASFPRIGDITCGMITRTNPWLSVGPVANCTPKLRFLRRSTRCSSVKELRTATTRTLASIRSIRRQSELMPAKLLPRSPARPSVLSRYGKRRPA